GDEQPEADDGNRDGHVGRQHSPCSGAAQELRCASHSRGFRMRRFLISVGGILLAVACSSQKPAARVDDSGLARLNEAQMEPVDEARVEEGRARDALARARASEADGRARLEVARSERSVSEAQLKRAQAEKDLLKRQYAS